MNNLKEKNKIEKLIDLRRKIDDTDNLEQMETYRTLVQWIIGNDLIWAILEGTHKPIVNALEPENRKQQKLENLEKELKNTKNQIIQVIDSQLKIEMMSEYLNRTVDSEIEKELQEELKEERKKNENK